VDSVPDPLLLRKSGSAGNRTRTSGSVAMNYDHLTTEAVYFLLHNIYEFSSYLTESTIHLRCVARNSDHRGGLTFAQLVHKFLAFEEAIGMFVTIFTKAPASNGSLSYAYCIVNT
jgi:hypothetical protein